ncbi:FG-GAP-like repeat-containing protein [Actinoplanes sichuanensis]|uniref:FG-GAP-like repeat-containing protein n=1 Tax=Actinoplanes sichuanensis TaxID=512349 RepID=A0ABW4ARM1_9ACTN|nr:FG-GAP-like repeat-containing protein [Actinoplanes sichuanensis]
MRGILRRRLTGGAVAAGSVAAVLFPVPVGAVGGTAVDGAVHPYLAKVVVGAPGVGFSCTGALVNTRWVVTAKSCFEAGGQVVVDGAPTVATTVTVGGAGRTATRVVPHPSRDVVLVKLATSVAGVVPVKVATTAPVAGQTLSVLGYGRTATEWVPGQAHLGTFTVSSVATVATGIAPATPGQAGPCKGDAGGPGLRSVAGGFELVAITADGGQGGCLGAAADATAGGTLTRLDDIAGWVTQTAAEIKPRGDFNGDGNPDLAAINNNRDMLLFPGDGAGRLPSYTPMWATGGAWAGYKAITAGDFNSDGKADVAGINAGNTLLFFPGDGAGKLLGYTAMWPTAGAFANYKAITAGDFNGDGRLDLAGINNNNDMLFFPGNGTGKLTTYAAMWPTGGAFANYKAITSGDFNGDGRFDIAAINNNNDMLLLPGDGAGKLTSYAAMWPTGGAFANYKGIAAGDFNTDGRLDIAAINNNNDMLLFPGNGAGRLLGYTAMWPTGGAFADYLAIG